MFPPFKHAAGTLFASEVTSGLGGSRPRPARSSIGSFVPLHATFSRRNLVRARRRRQISAILILRGVAADVRRLTSIPERVLGSKE